MEPTRCVPCSAFWTYPYCRSVFYDLCWILHFPCCPFIDPSLCRSLVTECTLRTTEVAVEAILEVVLVVRLDQVALVMAAVNLWVLACRTLCSVSPALTTPAPGLPCTCHFHRRAPVRFSCDFVLLSSFWFITSWAFSWTVMYMCV